MFGSALVPKPPLHLSGWALFTWHCGLAFILYVQSYVISSQLIVQLVLICFDHLSLTCKIVFFVYISHSRICEICGSTALNVAGVSDTEPIEQWSEANTSQAPPAVPPSETRSFWQGHRLLKFLVACLVLAFVVSWLFHFNAPGWTMDRFVGIKETRVKQFSLAAQKPSAATPLKPPKQWACFALKGKWSSILDVMRHIRSYRCRHQVCSETKANFPLYFIVPCCMVLPFCNCLSFVHHSTIIIQCSFILITHSCCSLYDLLEVTFSWCHTKMLQMYEACYGSAFCSACQIWTPKNDPFSFAVSPKQRLASSVSVPSEVLRLANPFGHRDPKDLLLAHQSSRCITSFLDIHRLSSS